MNGKEKGTSVTAYEKGLLTLRNYFVHPDPQWVQSVESHGYLGHPTMPCFMDSYCIFGEPEYLRSWLKSDLGAIELVNRNWGLNLS